MMKFSLSLGKKDCDATTDGVNPKTNPGQQKSAKQQNISGFGLDSDDESKDGATPSLPASKKRSADLTLGDSSRAKDVTSVASEIKKSKVLFNENYISKEELDPQLYLYDDLLDEDDPYRHNPNAKLIYLGYNEKSNDDKEWVKHRPPPPGQPVVKESQYMRKIIKAARQRKMERDIAYDRQLLKEELETGGVVGEVFVTSAYKKQLEERERFEAAQRRKEQEDELNAKKGLASLHSHMLKAGHSSRTQYKQ